MTTNSVEAFLVSLSNELGVEIIGVKFKNEASEGLEIRFKGLEAKRSFYFEVTRGWHATLVQVKPDIFAREVIEYLSDQLILNAEAVYKLLEENESSHSTHRIRIDGSELAKDFDDRVVDKANLIIECDVLSDSSALGFGLVNDQEQACISILIRLVLSLLPVTAGYFVSPDEVIGYPEGSRIQVNVNKYERDPRNRETAIELHGHDCWACGFNFQEFYGPLGYGYVVIHHTTPLSQLGPDYALDPQNDLIPLCANCHAIVHRSNPPLSLEDLRALITSLSRGSG